MAAPFKVKAPAGPIRFDFAHFKEIAHAKVKDDAIRRILVGDEALQYLRERHKYSELQLRRFVAQSQIPAVCVPRSSPTPSCKSADDDVQIEIGGTPLVVSRAGLLTIRKFVGLKQDRDGRAKDANAKASQSQKKPLSPQSTAPRASTDPGQRSERDKPLSVDAIPRLKLTDQRKWNDSDSSKVKRADTFASVMGDKLTALRIATTSKFRSNPGKKLSGCAYLYSLVMNVFFLVRNIMICVSGDHRVVARKKLLWPIFQQVWFIFFNMYAFRND